MFEQVARRRHNLAEARGRVLHHVERKREKHKLSYREKLKRLTQQINIARYEEEEIRIPLADRIERMLLHWREVVKIGVIRWFIDQEIRRVRKARRRAIEFVRRAELYRALMGNAYVPIAVEWRFPKIRVYVDEKIEEYLQSPKYGELVKDALAVIFADILRGKFLIEMKPEDLERLKGVLTFVKEKYFAPYREVPCKRSQYLVKLTPLTFRFLKGYGVRFYVLRFTDVKTLHNDPYIVVTKPIDIHFINIRKKKPWFEKVASMIFAGETPNLTGRETIPTAMNWKREPRNLMKTYLAMTLGYRINENFARALGFRERIANFDHCSIYVKPIIGKIYKPEKTIEREYRLVYRVLMLR